MPADFVQKLTKKLGADIIKSRPMAGGDIADVSLLTLSDGRTVVAKRPRTDQPDTTECEAFMLTHLIEKSEFFVPKVLFQDQGILVLEHIPHAGINNPKKAAESVAMCVAQLHTSRPDEKAPYYGLSRDTVIGPLPQINTPHGNWCSFFAENRLLAMAQSCRNTNRFDAAFMARIEKLTAKLPDLLPAAPDSSLLHGDLWSGNILIDGDKAAGFIDPAISYGHREMDLAFILLMGGLDACFLDAYNDHTPLEPGFREERMSLYQLWPLLVHVRLFAGGYVKSVSNILDTFGV